MPTELMWLGWSIVLGLVYVLVAAALGTWQRGLKWNVGNRDGDPKPLTAMAARAQRANRNFLETFAFFAAAALAVVLAHKSDAWSAMGAQIYFWARVVYLPCTSWAFPTCERWCGQPRSGASCNCWKRCCEACAASETCTRDFDLTIAAGDPGQSAAPACRAPECARMKSSVSRNAGELCRSGRENDSNRRTWPMPAYIFTSTGSCRARIRCASERVFFGCTT